MIEIKEKKYLLIISNKYNTEIQLYNTLEEMLEETGTTSIKELLDKSCWLCKYTIYEISKTYKKAKKVQKNE